MQDKEAEDLRAAIDALESQPATLGDASAALASNAQAVAIFEALNLDFRAAEAAANVALCKTRLGDAPAAGAAVDRILAELEADPGEASETIKMRWICQQVLDAAGDARAGPMLERLFADVQAHAAELTAAADRDRLIQALPILRDIVAAYRRLGREPLAPG
jgi:hypothetical protein